MSCYRLSQGLTHETISPPRLFVSHPFGLRPFLYPAARRPQDQRQYSHVFASLGLAGARIDPRQHGGLCGILLPLLRRPRLFFARHTVGRDDGPDDAIENCALWPELHALGAPDVVRRMYVKALEGHIRQYNEARTVQVPLARDGM